MSQYNTASLGHCRQAHDTARSDTALVPTTRHWQRTLHGSLHLRHGRGHDHDMAAAACGTARVRTPGHACAHLGGLAGPAGCALFGHYFMNTVHEYYSSQKNLKKKLKSNQIKWDKILEK